MGQIPFSPRASFLAWCEAHTTVWGTNATAIGLLAGQALEFTTTTTAAAAALAAQETARLAYKAATETCNDAFRDLRAITSSNVRIIRGFAEQQNKPSEVYALAQIDPPAPPTPMPAPGQPYQFRVGLLQTGALELKWKCDNPANSQGTVYEIFRRIGPTGAFSYLGSAGGDKTFVDDTLPSGSSSVAYQITGIRSGTRGLAAQFTVNFGVGGGGFTVMSITEDAVGGGAKLAA